MSYQLPQVVALGQEICTALEDAERREWWLTDGKGGYAGGTVAGTLTRRYHGLLIAPQSSSLQRRLWLAKADAELIDGASVIPLHTNRWGSGVIEPRGYQGIESFRLDGRMPVWRYNLGGIVVEARIWMEHGRHTTCLAWRLLENPSGREILLRVRLLTNIRDHHGNAGSDASTPGIRTTDHELEVTYPDCPALHIHSRCGVAESASFWVEDFDLPVERERGLPDRDRHYCVGYLTFPIHAGHWVGLTASLEQDETACYIQEAMQRFQARDQTVLAQAKVLVPEMTRAPAWIDQLILAADSFVIHHDSGNGNSRDAVLAGYPWFGEWGRDTMISLPGLLLANGRYRQARAVLSGYLPLVERGMLPNYFPGDGETPQYNTADAALWYLEAWRAYLAATSDLPAVADAWPVLQAIITSHRAGTRHRIGMDEHDGLLYAGETGVQLTWMDARVGNHVITPRIGKPVEINALWYNALQTMAQFAQAMKLADAAEEYTRLAACVRGSFKRYIRSDRHGLFDVLDGPDGDDESIRPNQILAVSLAYSPLDSAVQRDVVAVCANHLLVHGGLRTLDSAHPDYRPRLQGGVWERDSAYHQGTAWAWLLGHYAFAEYRVGGDAGLALQRLEPIRLHLNEAGLGTVSEIFDGDSPHTPRGCPAQAWSVACTLEAWQKLRHAYLNHTREQNHESS